MLAAGRALTACRIWSSCIVLIAEQADRRRERSIAHRIREARFRERQTAGDVRLAVQRPAIDRVQIEELATGDFIAAPATTWSWSANSGVGKSHLIQAMGRSACVLGYRVRYTTSAELLDDLTASLADQTFRAAALLRPVRPADHRRVRLRPHRTAGLARRRPTCCTRSSTPAAGSGRRRW